MSTKPALQTNWDWRAAGNYIGGGTGAGLLLISAMITLSGHEVYGMVLAAILFMITGLVLVWFEIGRPWRFLNVYLKPFTSWMSREAFLATVLVPVGLWTVWNRSAGMLMIAALLAVLFLYSQARILRACRGIRAWRIPEIIPVIMTTALVEGAGALLIAGPPLYEHAAMVDPATVFILVSILIVLRIWAWSRYRNVLEHDVPEGTSLALKKAHRPFIVYGHALPALLLAAGAAMPVNRYAYGLFLLAGMGVLLSGWYIKYVIVTQAAYNQGYALVRSPARGAGKAGMGAKPGWVE